jgi:hypothetical protein
LIGLHTRGREKSRRINNGSGGWLVRPDSTAARRGMAARIDCDSGAAGDAAGGVGGRERLVPQCDQRHAAGEDVYPLVASLERVVGWQQHARVCVRGAEVHCPLVVGVGVAVGVQGRDGRISGRASPS